MDRLMIIARLREGAHEEAQALIAAGPPFDPEELGFHRHSAYLSAGELVFLFEAPEVEWLVNDIVDDAVISAAFGPWRDAAPSLRYGSHPAQPARQTSPPRPRAASFLRVPRK